MVREAAGRASQQHDNTGVNHPAVLAEKPNEREKRGGVRLG